MILFLICSICFAGGFALASMMRTGRINDDAEEIYQLELDVKLAESRLEYSESKCATLVELAKSRQKTINELKKENPASTRPTG